MLKDEREKAESFVALPRRFFETSKVLLDVAGDDLTQPGQLRSLLKDLREIRQAKTRIGLQSEGVMRGSYLQVRRRRARLWWCGADPRGSVEVAVVEELERRLGSARIHS